MKLTITRNRSPIDTALSYAARGWPVFPCLPDHKEPATTHGFKDATTDADQIRAWWARRPNNNVAIATGAPGPDVVDVDVRPTGSGWTALNAITRSGLLTGTSRLVRTRSGGLHLYFEGTGQGCGSIRGRFLDYKASGGYVLAPPSTVGGGAYQLLEDRTGEHGRVDWAAVRVLLDPPAPTRPSRPRSAHAATDGLVSWLAGQPEGNRNNGLYWACRRALEDGRVAHIDELVAAAIAAGETETKATRTAQSAPKWASS